MSRVVLVITLWTFLALPSLCQAGWLVHACDQHSSSGCGHEGDCSDDPCAKSISASVPRTDTVDSTPQPAVMIPVQDRAILSPSAQVNGASLRRMLQEPPAPGGGLPLLI